MLALLWTHVVVGRYGYEFAFEIKNYSNNLTRSDIIIHFSRTSHQPSNSVSSPTDDPKKNAGDFLLLVVGSVLTGWVS